MSIDPTALTALIISLVALFVTCAQLLQQYLATADGYRRCRAEVMGEDWGSKTRMRMHWGELRFETMYYVPSLSIESINRSAVINAAPEERLFGADWETLDLKKNYVLGAEWRSPMQMLQEDEKEIAKGSGGEKVCWVALMKGLRTANRDLRKVYDVSAVMKLQIERGHRSDERSATPGIVCMRLLRRSWDFLPSEIVRPLSVSTISDIAVMAIRLEMTWKEFNPTKGTLLAEGSGQLITSQMVRSMGLCLDYVRTDPSKDHVTHERTRERHSKGDLLLNMYLPVEGVSDLIFGVVGGNKNLLCFNRSVGSLDAITEFLDFLDKTGLENLDLTKNLRSAMDSKPGWLPGFNDVIPLTAEKMSSVASQLRNIPMPNTYAAGLLRTREGLQVFCDRLDALIAEQREAKSEQILWVQDRISHFKKHYSEFWSAKDSEWGYVQPHDEIEPEPAYNAAEAYQHEIHRSLDAAEAFLVGINVDPLGSIRRKRKNQKLGLCYDTLLVEHLRMAVLAYGNIPETKKNFPEHWHIGPGREWLSASMHVYWDELEPMSNKLAEDTGCTAELAVDAWVTMIFRAFCWHHCHHLMPIKSVLPVEWHRSQMPVYIG